MSTGELGRFETLGRVAQRRPAQFDPSLRQLERLYRASAEDEERASSASDDSSA